MLTSHTSNATVWARGAVRELVVIFGHMAAAVLKLPEDSKDVLLVHKYTKAEGIARVEPAETLSLEVSFSVIC